MRAIADVIETTWMASALDLAEVEYFEGHGAGTKLGDTLELEGYARALLPLRERRAETVPVAAAKSAIGHGQTASGLASFIRALACIQDGVIYPTPLADPVTRMIDVERKGLSVVTRAAAVQDAGAASRHHQSWPVRNERPRHSRSRPDNALRAKKRRPACSSSTPKTRTRLAARSNSNARF